MSQPPVPASTFVVGLDRDEVLRRRAIVRRSQQFGVWAMYLGFALVLGLALVMVIAFADKGGMSLVLAVLVTASMVPLLYAAGKARAGLAASMRWFEANDMPPFAIRMSPQALELGCEGAAQPVVLPWPLVRGFELRRRYGQDVLLLALQPGVTTDAPGTSGLDQPAARAALFPDRSLKSGGFYGVASLDQPVPAIDQAMRYFSGGAAGIISS